ncbi:hypothetical protein HYALB_00013109 [Hymenoscyphus albidus]|uniref:Uncharacterized protein n=1 Tax=Hymenoscyphus albidus TaxID=595503 RepID=A0A9N9Q3K4_9HELO|nr:hypothetical protein HYALB_00013109 [Hymenoscyphus albidus]
MESEEPESDLKSQNLISQNPRNAMCNKKTNYSGQESVDRMRRATIGQTIAVIVCGDRIRGMRHATKRQVIYSSESAGTESAGCDVSEETESAECDVQQKNILQPSSSAETDSRESELECDMQQPDKLYTC